MSSVCTKCKEDKPTTEFHADKYRKSGVSSWCKTCKGKSCNKTCCLCKEKYVGGVHSKNCPTCIKTKPVNELYNRKKPISKCATCENQAKNSRSKYCEKCLEENTRKQKREWIANKRETDPDFVEKERIYLQNYCEGKGITLVDLWGEINGIRATKEQEPEQD